MTHVKVYGMGVLAACLTLAGTASEQGPNGAARGATASAPANLPRSAPAGAAHPANSSPAPAAWEDSVRKDLEQRDTELPGSRRR
jgi:hypothetical protein